MLGSLQADRSSPCQSTCDFSHFVSPQLEWPCSSCSTSCYRYCSRSLLTNETLLFFVNRLAAAEGTFLRHLSLWIIVTWTFFLLFLCINIIFFFFFLFFFYFCFFYLFSFWVRPKILLRPERNFQSILYSFLVSPAALNRFMGPPSLESLMYSVYFLRMEEEKNQE